MPVLERNPGARDFRIHRRAILLPERAVLIVADRTGQIEPLIETELLLDVLAERLALGRRFTGRLDRAGVDARDPRRKHICGVERSVKAIANPLHAARGLGLDPARELPRRGGSEIGGVLRARPPVDGPQPLPIKAADLAALTRCIVRLVRIVEIVEANRTAGVQETERSPVALHTIREARVPA